MSAQQAAQASQSLVSSLPLRLRNFFAKYPPQIYSASVAPRPTPPSTTATSTTATTTHPSLPSASDAKTDSTTTPELSTNSVSAESLENSNSVLDTLEPLPSPYTPNRQAKGSKKQDPLAWSPSKALLYSNPEHPNPFLPRKNFVTGKWIGPKYGLREQADLVKLARKYNIEALLPPGRKSTEFKETRRLEKGLQIKGIGVGQKVKGHKWERQMETKLEERRKAMLEMPEMIRLWKQRGHGRGWKKWPRK